MNNDSEFLTTEDAARLLNVHVNTIIRWIKQGKLPASQIGREYRIPRPSIELLASGFNDRDLGLFRLRKW